MLGYLAALSQACLYQGGLELVVVFNGTLGKDRWPEWARRAQGQRQTAQLIVNHVGSKATPPPRAWFLPPACLSHCVRLAMFRFRVRVSAEDVILGCLDEMLCVLYHALLFFYRYTLLNKRCELHWAIYRDTCQLHTHCALLIHSSTVHYGSLISKSSA